MKAKLTILILVVCLALPIVIGTTAISSDVEIIGILNDREHFKYPQSLFVDLDSDKLIVADTGHKTIKVLDTEGTYISSFGDTKLKKPTKVIKDEGSRYIVCDPEGGKISLFDRRGEFLADMNVSNDETVGVVEPVSMAYNSKGHIVILDRSTCQIKIFNAAGAFLYSVSRQGEGDGELESPSDLVVDEHDNYYITDTGNDRVCVFDKVGNYVRSFGQGEMSSPIGIAIFGNKIYVTDTGNSQIDVYLTNGKPVKSVGAYGFALEELKHPTGIHVDSNGHLWVTDSGNNRIIHYNGELVVVDSIGQDGSSLKPRGIVVVDDLIYVAEASSNQINVYDFIYGDYVQSIGAQGTNVSNLKNPEDCEISSRGDLVVADTGNSRIQIFSKLGDHLVGFGEYGSGVGKFDNPAGLGISRESGNIFVADTGNKRVVSLTLGGTWEFTITKGLEEPVDVAIDMNNRIWVVDAALGEVLIYKEDGTFEKSLSDVAFTNPSSITIDEFGRVFITDAGTSSVRVFADNGYELASFGRKGGPNTSNEPPFFKEGYGDFLNPAGIYVSSDWVVISDTGNGRIQKIPVSNFGGLPKLGIGSDEIFFEKVPLSTKRSKIIQITNHGNGVIKGEVATDTNWIEVVPTEFEGEIELRVFAVGEKAKEGQREGSITITSNGGTKIIPVVSRFFDGQVKRVVMHRGYNEVEANGRTIKVSPAPFIDKNYYSIYVPFRFIGEELGANVVYNGTKIHYLLEGKSLEITIDSKTATLSGKSIEMPSPAYKLGTSPLVPLRFVVESLGGSVDVIDDEIIAEYP